MMYLLLLLPILGFGALSASTGEAKMPATNSTDYWTRFDPLFKQYGTIYGVNWQWLKAICMNESNLGRAPSVARGLASPEDIGGSTSSDGKSWGIMQVTLSTARTIDEDATEIKLNDPDYSVQIAAQYISQLQGQFSSLDPRFTEFVIKSYNQGPGNTRREIASGHGYADTYWDRFQTHLSQVVGT